MKKFNPKKVCYGILIGLIITLVMPVFRLGFLPIKFSDQISNDNFIKGTPFVYFGNQGEQGRFGLAHAFVFNGWAFLADFILWSIVGVFIYAGMIKIIQSEEIKLNHPVYRKAKF